jgi:hypothetical protein
MHQSDLAITKKSIEKYCKENQVVIFYGLVEENGLTIVEWNDDTKGKWNDYLNVAKAINCKIVTLEVFRNKIDTEDEVISEYMDSLEKDDLEIFKEALASVKNNDNQIISLTLSFFHNGVSYKCEVYSDFATNYLTVSRVFDDENYDNEKKRLSEEEIEQKARKILTNERFLECKTTPDRIRIARDLAREEVAEDQFIETYKIGERTEQLYMREIHPKKEEELKKKIQELKLKGLRKVEVRSKLGIGEAALNKYWY